MSDSRKAFEQAFLNQYTDFERFENGEYMDDFLQQSWIGWQASRRAISSCSENPNSSDPASRQDFEGEPVAWWDGDTSAAEDSFSFKLNRCYTIPLYTHPASAVPDAEYIRALKDAFDIIQADANTEQNYGSLCRMGWVLARLKSVQEQDDE